MKRTVMAVVLTTCLTAMVAWGQEGYLRVTSTPAGATIALDGKDKGKAPLSLVVPVGKYTMTAKLSGYETVTQAVVVTDGEVTRMQPVLEKIPTKQTEKTTRTGWDRYRSGVGNLSVTSDWANTAIYLDGYTTNLKAPATFNNITSGPHTVVLISNGYALVDRVWVQAKQTFKLDASFEELKTKYAARQQEAQEAAKSTSASTSAATPWTNAAATLEQKRQALPAQLTVVLEKLVTTKTSGSVLWDQSDEVVIQFQYRKAGEEAWVTKEIKMGETMDTPISLEKGIYDIQVTAQHYKVDKGLLTIFVEGKKTQVGSAAISFKKELKPDVGYIFTVKYDGQSALSHTVVEKAVNTPVQ